MATTTILPKQKPSLKHLSGLDATFLYLETPQTPMHVGSLHLYELPPGFKGSFYTQVVKHLAGRIHLSPIFLRRLHFMPLDLGHPIWVDDEAFDIAHHVRQVSTTGKKIANIPTIKQLEASVAKLHSKLIDRKHPLWEFYVFDKVLRTDGTVCAAFYSKIHHAALDGQGGTVLANAVLDISPQPREVAPPDPLRKRRLAGDLKIGEMIGAVFSNSLAQYAKLIKSLPTAAAQLGNSLTAGAQKTKLPTALVPQTPFNTGITAERVFVTASIPFASCRAMAKAMGASFNDVVLWICSTALRNYLKQHAAVPAKPLVAAMPVSLREGDNKDMSNQASMSLVNLATHIAHPVKRMAAIMESTSKVKEALLSLKSVIPTDYPGFLAPWIVGGAARLALKTYGQGSLAQRLPMVANVVISNVPGPQVPLYMAGARMLTFHPLSIVMHGLGLNITVQTYAGSVDFGIIAGKKALLHPQDLADALQAAYEQACKLFVASQVDASSVLATAREPKSIKNTVSDVTEKQVPIPKSRSKKTVTLKQNSVSAKRKV